MSFPGFSDEALAFFDGLEADTTTSYWLAHRATYAAAVQALMGALLEELAGQRGEGRPFRAYRDVRFSADKPPYKTHIGARIGEDLYVQLSAAGLPAAAGMWQMAGDQLARYRETVAADAPGGRLAAIVVDLPGELMGHARLVTVPRGFPRDHPRADLLCYEGLAAWMSWGAPDWLATDEAPEKLKLFFAEVQPLVDWLHENVGPSDLPRERWR